MKHQTEASEDNAAPVPQADPEATLKPYYQTLEIQQQCEEFDNVDGRGQIDQYMRKEYMRHGKQVIKAQLRVYSTGSRMRYRLEMTIANEDQTLAYNKTYTTWTRQFNP